MFVIAEHWALHQMSQQHQFMFGDDWLVAPVTLQSAKSWTVYLPQLSTGEEWIYWWNASSVSGGRWVQTITTNLTEFPLFKRGTAHKLQG